MTGDAEENVPSDVSSGAIADPHHVVQGCLPAWMLEKFEVFSYRNAASILSGSYPDEFAEVCQALEQFEISTKQIRAPGGSKSEIALYFDTLFSDDWVETRITADLTVKLLAAKGGRIIDQYTRNGFLDGHRIDFVKGRVALDLEWNSKDQTYDRDLYAFSAFYEAGAIDLGIIITRGTSLDNHFFRSLGKVLEKDGSEGRGDVYKKYGASTTWMGKLLYRLDAGRNGGCPVIAIGIKPECVSDYDVKVGRILDLPSAHNSL